MSAILAEFFVGCTPDDGWCLACAHCSPPGGAPSLILVGVSGAEPAPLSTLIAKASEHRKVCPHSPYPKASPPVDPTLGGLA